MYREMLAALGKTKKREKNKNHFIEINMNFQLFNLKMVYVPQNQQPKNSFTGSDSNKICVSGFTHPPLFIV